MNKITLIVSNKSKSSSKKNTSLKTIAHIFELLGYFVSYDCQYPKKTNGIRQWIKEKIIHRKTTCACCGESYLAENGIWLNIYGFPAFHTQKIWLCDMQCFDEFYHETEMKEENCLFLPLCPESKEDLHLLRNIKMY